MLNHPVKRSKVFKVSDTDTATVTVEAMDRDVGGIEIETLLGPDDCSSEGSPEMPEIPDPITVKIQGLNIGDIKIKILSNKMDSSSEKEDKCVSKLICSSNYKFGCPSFKKISNDDLCDRCDPTKW